MYTPQEVQDKKFPKAVFGGYDMGEVDDFLDAVSADYAALYKENAVLKSKMKVLAEKVEEYRGVDAAMRHALIAAQKMANEMTEEAKLKSEEIRSKAQEDYENAITALRDNINNEERRLEMVKEEAQKFVEANIRVCELQIHKFKSLMTEPIEIPKRNSFEETAQEIERTISQVIERTAAKELHTPDITSPNTEDLEYISQQADDQPNSIQSIDFSVTAEELLPILPDLEPSESAHLSWMGKQNAQPVRPIAKDEEKVQEVNVGGMNIRVFEMELGGDKSSKSS